MPSNPGWPFGYVPTASEWATAFGNKVDYPAPVDQGGTGGTSAAAGNYNLQQRRLIASGPASLGPLSFNGILTNSGAITLLLPQLFGLIGGDWIDIADVDFNANVNNITLQANGGDQISLFGVAANTQVLNVAGVQARLVAGLSTWSLLV